MADPPKSVAAPVEPTRPETVRQPGWAQSQSRPAQEQSATEYNKAAQAKQAAIHEAAKRHAPKPEQQRAQELQKDKGQER